jgi:NADH:ubiquinone oxidoreductase subunit 2 (subunit N)
MGALVIDLTAMSALLFLLIVQLFAWVGAFFLLGFMMDQLKSDRLVDLRGYLGVAAPECIGLLLCLVCAIGLPPSPGFLAKFALIESAFDHQRYFLVVISIVSMALSSTAVARLAFNLVGNFATSGPAHPIIKEGSSIPRRIYLMGLLTPVILVGIFAEWVMNWAQSSIRIILW